MIDLNRIHQFLRAEFDKEAAAGFARLRRVPDMHVRHFLDYYRSLDVAEQSALADASTLWGAHTFRGSALAEPGDVMYGVGEGAAREERTFGGFDPASAPRSNIAWTKWMDETTNGQHRDRYWYASVPLLRLYRAEASMRRKTGQPPPSDWHRMMEEYASSVAGAKAPALRKLVRELVQGRFRGRSTKGSGGDWTYEGEVQGSRVFLSIDWGGHYAQLRYSVRVDAAAGTLNLSRGFEASLGAGHGDWDFLTEENAAESIALLGDLIDDVAQWPARLSDDH